MKSTDPAFEEARQRLAQKLARHIVNVGENNCHCRAVAVSAHCSYALLLRRFNREYSRLFGQPPMRDVKALRATELWP